MIRTARALGVLFASAAAALASGQVVISQVDGNGGLGVDPYDRDFVELFNRGSTPVNLTGWSLQLFGDFGNATTVATPAWDVIPLSGTILPGQYFLVVPSFQRGSLGSSVATDPLPAPDVMGPVYDGAVLVSESNAVALMSTTAPIAAGQCPGGRPDLVDLFRFGYPNALCFEGPAPAGPTTTGGQRAVVRGGGGCIDGNNSQEDLVINVEPTPRNSDTNAFVPTTVAPGSVVAGAGGLVTITATRGASACNPLAGALTAASVNLSSLGLGSAQAMVDDGTSGDASAGDGVFTTQFTVSAGQAVGTYVLPITASSGATSLPVSARLRVFPAAATNDTCASAINLSDPAPGGIDIINDGPYATAVNATAATGDGIDAGTCNGDAEVKFSVWYTLTTGAGQSGALHISDLSSEDLVYSLHTSCGGASIQCANREDIGLVLAPNTTYFIQIGRETGASQPPQTPYQLTFEFVPSPGNDTQCGAEVIGSFPFTATPFAPAYTNDAFNISCDSTLNTDARFGAWYTFTTGATSGALEIFERSINGTNFTLFAGLGCGNLAAVQCVDETTAGAIISGLTPSTTYHLLVSIDSNSLVPSTPYDFTINLIPRPVNDDCSGAIDLNMVGLPFAQSVTARAAATDAGAPSGTGGSGVNTCSATLVTRNAGVWYTYTTGPTVSGTLRVADLSSNDLFYNVFTGTCGALTPAQCWGAFNNDDIFIQLAPNTTYSILVSLASTTAGTLPTSNYDLTFTLYPAPANDLACNATLVTTTSFHDAPAGPSATADVDTTCNFNNPPQSSTGYGVWYRVQPAGPTLLKVNDLSSDDLVIALFTGSDCNALTEIDCKMGGQIPADYAYFNLMGGTNYWVLIGRIANSQPFGLYGINIDLLAPTGACCSSSGCTVATQADCVASGGGFRGAFTTCGDTPSYQESPGVAIPDAAGGLPGSLSRTITVTDAGTVRDLKVLVELTHARVGDLIMTITGPSSATQDLIRRIDDTDGGCPAFGSQGRLTDMGGTYIFDDQVVNPYGPSMPPAAKYFDFTGLVVPSGHYQPTTCNDVVVSLNSIFAGQSITGPWTLTITDNQTSSTGTLNRWGLIVNGGANGPCSCRADFNGNGSVTVQDIFDFLAAYFTNSPGADINGVGGVSVQDIFDFLAMYFTGC